jgi:hypothetical protein
MVELTLDSRVVASPNQLSTYLNGEAVILDLQSGTYYGLEGVAARIWSLLQEPATCADMATTLCEEYAVERPQIEVDLLSFVAELREIGLIEVLS